MEDPADLKDSAPSLSPSDHVLDHQPPKNTSDQEEQIIQDGACTDVSDISDTSLEVQGILRWDGLIFETNHDNDVDYFENAHDVDFGIDLNEPEECVIYASVEGAKEEQEASSSEEKNKMMGSPEVVPRVTSPARHRSQNPKMASRGDDVMPSIQQVEKQKFVKCLSEMREIKDELHGLKSLMDKSDEETNVALSRLYDCQMHQKKLMVELESQKEKFAENRILMIELSSIVKYREKEIEDLRKQVSHNEVAFSDLQESFEKKEYEIQILNNRLKETDEERLQLKTIGLCLSRTLESLTYTVKNTMTADLAQTRLQTMPTISMDRVIHQRRELAKRLHACIHMVALEFKELYFSRAPDSTTEGKSTEIVPFNITEMASVSEQPEPESRGQCLAIAFEIDLDHLDPRHDEWGVTGRRMLRTLKQLQRIMDMLLISKTFVEAALEAKLMATNQRMRDVYHQLDYLKRAYEQNCLEKEEIQKECIKLRNDLSQRNKMIQSIEMSVSDVQSKMRRAELGRKKASMKVSNKRKLLNAQSEKISSLKADVKVMQEDKDRKMRDVQQKQKKVLSELSSLNQLCQRKNLKLNNTEAKVVNLTDTLTRTNRVMASLRKELDEAKKDQDRVTEITKNAVAHKMFLKEFLASEIKKRKQLQEELCELEKEKTQLKKMLQEKMDQEMKEMKKKIQQEQNMQKKKKSGAMERVMRMLTRDANQKCLDC